MNTALILIKSFFKSKYFIVYALFFGGANLLYYMQDEPTWKDKAACAGVRSYYLDEKGTDDFLWQAATIIKENNLDVSPKDVAKEVIRVYHKMHASEDADYLAKRLVDRCL